MKQKIYGKAATDKRILNLLQQECRMSFHTVASKTHVSVGTAYNRIKNLEAKGLIKGYTALVDSLKLGLTLTAVVFIQAKGENLAMFEAEIASEKSVMAVYDITGEFDAALVVKFKNRDELNCFIKYVAASTYIKRTVTCVSLNTVKEDFRIELPNEELTRS